MKQIIGANQSKIRRIEMALPIDRNGDYVYNEAGEPISGREAMVLVVPRFDCLEREQIKVMNRELRELDDKKDSDGLPLTPQDKSLQQLMIMVKPFLPEADLNVLEHLRPVELDQIAQYWQDQSTISLGELLASTNS
jgi:hypothetical protein